MKEYIERERLYELGYWHGEAATFDNPFPDGVDAVDTKDIDSIPAADVRPVVKAHWTDHRTNEHDGEWYCSACGKEITIYMGPDRDDRYSYCPNCGADMREANDGI